MVFDPIRFRQRFAEAFEGVAPISYILRVLLAERWLRVHSLPAAKRYAGTPAEWAELLARHHAVLGHVLGEGMPCTIITTDSWSDPGDPEPPGGHGTLFATIDAAEVEPGSADPGARLLRFFAREATWRSGAHDELLVAVADDRVRRVIFVADAAAALVAPYDGGIDMIAPDPATRDTWAQRFAAWRSPRPDGL
jgi:hypothetical protein